MSVTINHTDQHVTYYNSSTFTHILLTHTQWLATYLTTKLQALKALCTQATRMYQPFV